MMKAKVCIIGAEGWGSALSTAVCQNVIDGGFDKRVHIYVFDELVRSKYLSEVMNEQHENIKYLPGIKLAPNLIAVNDLIEAALDADILIFATSHDFIRSYCNKLAGKVKSTAYAVSLLKGLDHIGDGEFALYSNTIADQLQIPCYSLMCANSAMEMAQGKLCEITIGCDNVEHAQELVTLLETENCKVFSIDDVDGVELCNTLKDLVALSAGFIDGLRLGDNARVTCLHLGLKEMMRFIKTFNPSTKLCTLFESCGIANSIASSYGDKNVTFAKNFVTMQKTVQEIEMNLLNGRQLLGPLIAAKVFHFLEKKQLQDEYPLFTIIHRICQNEVPPQEIIETLRTHPDLSNYSITELQKQEYYEMPLPHTHSILENLVDTVPENITEDVREAHGKYENKFIAHEDSSSHKSRPLNNLLPANPNLGFSFDISSTDSKPEIYNKLKEASMMPQCVESKSSFEDSRLLSEFTSKMRFEDTDHSDQLIVMMGSDEKDSKLGVRDESNLVNLTKLIEQHVKPFNDHFKSIKVRVKVKAEHDAKNFPFKKDGIPTHNLTVRKARSKPSLEPNFKNVGSIEDGELENQKELANFRSKKHDVEIELSEDKEESSKSKKDQSDVEFKDEIKQELTMSKQKQSDWEYILEDDESSTHTSKKDQISAEKIGEEVSEESSTFKSKKYEIDDMENKMTEVSDESSTTKSKLHQIGDMKNKWEEVSEESSTLKAKKHQIDDVENKFEEVSEESSTSKSKIDQTDDMESKLDEESQQSSISVLKKRKMEEMEFINNTNEDFEIAEFDRKPKASLNNSEITQSIREPMARATNFGIKQINQQPKACATNTERYTVYVVGEKRSSRRDFMDKFVPKHEKRIDKVPLQFSSTNNSYYPSNQYVINRHDYPEQSKIELNNTPQKRHYESQWRDGNIKDHSNVKSSTNTSSEKKDSNAINNVSNFQMKSMRSDRPPKKALSEKLVVNQMENVTNSNSEATTSIKPSAQNSGNIDTRNEVKETKNLNNSTGKNYVLSTDMRDMRRSIEQPAVNAVNDGVVNNKIESESNSNNHVTTSETTSSDKGLEESPSKSSEKQRLDSSTNDNIRESNLFKSDDNDKQTNELGGGLKPESIEERLFSIESSEYEKYIQSLKDPQYQSISSEEKNVEQANDDKPAYTKIEEEIHGEKLTFFGDANHRMEEPVYSNLLNEDKKNETMAELEQDMHSKEKGEPEAIESRIERNQEVTDKANPKDSQYSLINDKKTDYSSTSGEKRNNVFDRLHDEIHKQKIEQMDDIAMINDIRDASKQVTGKKDQSVYLQKNEGPQYQSRPEWAWLFNNDKFDVQKINPHEKIEELQPENLSDKERYLGENIRDIKEKTEYQEVFEKNLSTKADNLDKKYVKNEPLPVSEERTSEPKEDNRENKENVPHADLSISKEQASDAKAPLRLSFLDQLTRKLKSHRQRKEKEAVTYDGDDPYKKKSLSARYYLQEAKDSDKVQKIGPARPDAYPPINPRMPIPRPPFDVRDQEYHTVSYRPPPDLQRPRLLPRRRMQVSIHTRQSGGACSHVTKLPTPLFKLPQSVMRSSALAVELGLLAGLLTHYKRGCK